MPKALPPPKLAVDPLYKDVPLRTAKELLDVLAPHHHDEHLWDRGDEEHWIFRGQAEAVWQLVPSAQRPNAFLPFIPGQVTMGPLSPLDRLPYETSVVLHFNSLVSDKGLEVPGDSQDLRHEGPGAPNGADFPPVKYRGMYALAQHYGVPTRLLDWTGKPLVAAYFAAVTQARRLVKREPPLDDKSDGRFAVWALQRAFVERVSRKWDPGIVTVTVPTTSNPNLALQAGLFTLVFFHHPPAVGQDIPPLDDLLKYARNVANARKVRGLPPLPVLYKFTVPHEEARHLLHYLDRHVVNAATVFAGHRAVTEYLLEAGYRARPGPVGSRKGGDEG